MKVITYNILNCGYDLFPSKRGWWLTRTFNQRKMLMERDADIICMQEATILQTLIFMTMWGYRVHGIFSQDPIFYKKSLKCKHHETKRIPSVEYPRWYTLCILNKDNKQICVADTHLDWDVETHETQKGIVSDALFKYDGCHVVCGDFNVENDTFGDLYATQYEGYSFDSGKTPKKIDYIFNEKQLNGELCYEAKNLSDHYPLIAEL